MFTAEKRALEGTPSWCARKGCSYARHSKQRHGFCCHMCRVSADSHGFGCEERPGPTGTAESCERLLYDVELSLNVKGHARRAVLVVGANARHDAGFDGAGSSSRGGGGGGGGGTRSGLTATVVVLHGGLGSASNMRELTNFDAIAAREGINVCFGEGHPVRQELLSAVIGHTACAWNTGHKPGHHKGVDEQNDIE